jgi:hypothetical protein
MADSFALNKGDLKSAYIAVAIAVAGGLYWMYQRSKSSASGNGSGLFGAALNNTSAASGTAGAIAPSSSINTYNVFPTVSSQNSTQSAFVNGPHGSTSPSALTSGSKVWLSNGQGFSLPVKT